MKEETTTDWMTFHQYVNMTRKMWSPLGPLEQSFPFCVPFPFVSASYILTTFARPSRSLLTSYNPHIYPCAKVDLSLSLSRDEMSIPFSFFKYWRNGSPQCLLVHSSTFLCIRNIPKLNCQYGFVVPLYFLPFTLLFTWHLYT